MNSAHVAVPVVTREKRKIFHPGSLEGRRGPRARWPQRRCGSGPPSGTQPVAAWTWVSRVRGGVERSSVRPMPTIIARKSMIGCMRRVLVVDDEENIRLVLRTLLRKHGYEVEVAADGKAALAAVDSFDPDVILTDVKMPQMGGIELVGELKHRQHRASVIVMSAYGSIDLAIEAMKAGAYDYVSKPFKTDEVVCSTKGGRAGDPPKGKPRAP